VSCKKRRLQNAGVLFASVIRLSGHCDILRTLFRSRGIPLNLSQHISDSQKSILGKSDSAQDISWYNCFAYLVGRKLSSCVFLRGGGGKRDGAGEGAREWRATDGLQIAANRWGSVCNALFHETTERLIRCKFMKHRFVSLMWERERKREEMVASRW